MLKSLLKPKSLCISAAIAALYTVLTLALAPISYGSLQCRISEALTVLPMFFPEAVPGLFIGCLLANLFSPAPFLPDIIFGSLTTLAAALLTWRLRANKPFFAFLPPVLLNAVVVGIIVQHFYAPEVPLLLCMLQVGAGQAVAVYALGGALWAALKKMDIRRLLRI